MAAAGFEYTTRAYVAVDTDDETQPSPFDGLTDLNSPDVIGYGGVWNAIASLAPSGEPRGQLTSEQQLASYDNALLGSFNDAAHDHSENENPVGDGCRGVGREARLRAVDGRLPDPVSDEFNEIRAEFMQRVVALPTYQEFSEDWVACKASDGIEVVVRDPAFQRAEYLSQHFPTAVSVVAGLFEVEREAGQGPLLELHSASIVDGADLERVAAFYPEIEELLASERDIAVSDATCRHASMASVQREIELLVSDLEP